MIVVDMMQWRRNREGAGQHSKGVPPEVLKMLPMTVYFNSPVQMCEQGFLESLECIIWVPLHQKG